MGGDSPPKKMAYIPDKQREFIQFNEKTVSLDSSINTALQCRNIHRIYDNLQAFTPLSARFTSIFAIHSVNFFAPPPSHLHQREVT